MINPIAQTRVTIFMHLSIVSAFISSGTLGGEEWGFDQTSDQISHHLDMSVKWLNPLLTFVPDKGYMGIWFF